jgi:hypothetical protein
MSEETLESNSATSETTGSTESSSTGSIDTSTDVTQSTTTNEAGSSNATGSTDVETQAAEAARPDHTTSVETTNETAKPAIDYKQRYADQLKSWQQENAERQRWQTQADTFQRELAELKKQYQGIQPQEIEKYRSQQQVPVWDEQSPGHQQFLELRRTYDLYERAMRSAPDDATKQWLGQQMSQEIGPEGAKVLREWQADYRRQEWERQNNPSAFYRKLIQKEAQPVIQQSLQNVSSTYQSVQSAQQEVQKWMTESKEVATPENIKAVLGLMEKGETFATAAARVERDHFRTLVSTAKKAQQSAEEKERLLQGNASGTIARNPNTAKKVDFKAVVKERGITNERDRIDLLFDLDNQGML